MFRLAVVLILACGILMAQPVPPSPGAVFYVTANPTGNCGYGYATFNKTTGAITSCQAGTWATAGGGGGSGTVTVVGSGSLTNTALVTGGGTTTIQTPNTSSTLSSGGALSLPSSYTTLQSIGASTTDGTVLSNTTAAANNAQQWSPRLHFIGQGWKTTATAASQQVEWRAEVVPLQSTTNPGNSLIFTPTLNGVDGKAIGFCSNATGAPGTYLVLDANLYPNCTVGGGITGLGVVNSGGMFGVFSNGAQRATWGNNGLFASSNQIFGWASGTVSNVNTGDTGLCRNSAGVVCISDGAATPDSNGSLAFTTVTNGGWAAGTQGGCATATDLVVDGTNNKKVTSGTYTFVAADVAGWIDVTAGAGWTTGRYPIASVAGGAATLYVSPAAVSTTGGTFIVNRGKMVFTNGTVGSTADTFNVCKASTAGAMAWVSMTGAL